MAPKIYAAGLLLLFVNVMNASGQSSYKEILKRYNKSLNVVSKGLLSQDSSMAYNIMANNEAFYMRLIDIDTLTAKIYMSENILFLDSLTNELKNTDIPDSIKHKHIISYYETTAWYRRQQLNSALERCPSCFLIRKVRVTVMKRVNDQRLDTVKCVSIDYRKVLPNNISSSIQALISFPCPEYEQTLSTGPNYQFTVHYNGAAYKFNKDILIGSALTDIQKVTFIIPPQ